MSAEDLYQRDLYGHIATAAEADVDQPTVAARLRALLGPRMAPAIDASDRADAEPVDDVLQVMDLAPLSAEAVTDIATSLVGENQARALTRLLIEQSRGVPVAIAEVINFLWDRRTLLPINGRWRLTEDLDALALAEQDLNDLILRRLHRLPASTRRLTALAAMIGPRFDSELMVRTADEHPQVVDLGLETLLERWLIRRSLDSFTRRRRERDIVMWSKGARRGDFEFAHARTWYTLYHGIHPDRRALMHEQLAECLVEANADRPEAIAEALAYHYQAAHRDDEALPHLLIAADKAEAMHAPETARHYLRRALTLIERMLADDGLESDRRDELSNLRHTLQTRAQTHA
ncbi:MAG: hypothetical protein AAF772_13720 [Acidobacteriota bacterium]